MQSIAQGTQGRTLVRDGDEAWCGERFLTRVERPATMLPAGTNRVGESAVFQQKR